LFLLSVTLPLKLKERKVIRAIQPIKIRLEGQTPARFAFDILAGRVGRSLPSNGSAKVIDLNRELEKVRNKKPVIYVLPPMRINISNTQHSLGKAKVLIGAKQTTGEWNSKSLEFSGALELTGETALGPGRQLEIKWQGEKATETHAGEISLGWDKSEYRVTAPYLGGEIVAQLKDEAGDIIGEGRVPLGNPLSLIELARSPIRIKPVRDGAQFYDFNKLTAGIKSASRLNPKIEVAHLKGERSLEDLGYVTKSLSPGSATFARALLDGYSSTTALVSDHHSQEIPLFKKRTEQNYRYWLHETIGEKVTSIHLGKVLNKNKTQSGVEIVVETDKQHRVLYLNDMLVPDKNLKSTTESGYFLIINLEPGFYSLSINGLGQKLAYSQFVVDSVGLSYGEHLINFHNKKKSIAVFDLFSGLGEQALIFNFSSTDPDIINKEGVIGTSFSAIGQSYLSVSPKSAEYLKVTYLDHLNETNIEIPLIPAPWFNEFLVMNRVSFDRETSFLIGAFFEDDIEIELPLLDERATVLYFDHRGMRNDAPVNGGGFIVSGIPANSLQLLIIKDRTGNKTAKAFSVELGEIMQISTRLF